MYASTLLCLLPLLSLPLTSASASASGPGLEAREIYGAAHRRAASPSPDQVQGSHGHGHFSNSVFNSYGHGHGGPSRRNLHPEERHVGSAHDSGVKKLVRRRKQQKRGKTCKAPTDTAQATATSTGSTEATIPAVENAARPTKVGTDSEESSSAAAPWYTAAPTVTDTDADATSSASATAWESSAVSSDAESASASTSSSAAPPESTSGGTSGLFPWGTGSASWTTSEGGLSFDSALKPLSAGRLPSTRSAPDGSNALVADFPAGTVGLSSAGFSFYTEGSTSGVSVTSAKEVSFSYSVYLNDGFSFVKGGKMPGLFGGTSFDQAKSCSGGRKDSRDSCFSARLMWRTDGAGEIYDYLPVPYTDKDTGYGESIQRGAYTWATGRWTTVAMRVKLNDIGQANGEQELIVDGQSVISLNDVTFGTSEGTKIYGIMAQTFFGGHTDDWASPSDQSIWFKDWSLAVLA